MLQNHQLGINRAVGLSEQLLGQGAGTGGGGVVERRRIPAIKGMLQNHQLGINRAVGMSSFWGSEPEQVEAG
jgi:hypothetical protein